MIVEGPNHLTEVDSSLLVDAVDLSSESNQTIIVSPERKRHLLRKILMVFLMFTLVCPSIVVLDLVAKGGTDLLFGLASGDRESLKEAATILTEGPRQALWLSWLDDIDDNGIGSFQSRLGESVQIAVGNYDDALSLVQNLHTLHQLETSIHSDRKFEVVTNEVYVEILDLVVEAWQLENIDQTVADHLASQPFQLFIASVPEAERTLIQSQYQTLAKLALRNVQLWEVYSDTDFDEVQALEVLLAEFENKFQTKDPFQGQFWDVAFLLGEKMGVQSELADFSTGIYQVCMEGEEAWIGLARFLNSRDNPVDFLEKLGTASYEGSFSHLTVLSLSQLIVELQSVPDIDIENLGDHQIFLLYAASTGVPLISVDEQILALVSDPVVNSYPLEYVQSASKILYFSNPERTEIFKQVFPLLAGTHYDLWDVISFLVENPTYLEEQFSETNPLSANTLDLDLDARNIHSLEKLTGVSGLELSFDQYSLETNGNVLNTLWNLERLSSFEFGPEVSPAAASQFLQASLVGFNTLNNPFSTLHYSDFVGMVTFSDYQTDPLIFNELATVVSNLDGSVDYDSFNISYFESNFSLSEYLEIWSNLNEFKMVSGYQTILSERELVFFNDFGPELVNVLEQNQVPENYNDRGAIAVWLIANERLQLGLSLEQIVYIVRQIDADFSTVETTAQLSELPAELFSEFKNVLQLDADHWSGLDEELVKMLFGGSTDITTTTALLSSFSFEDWLAYKSNYSLQTDRMYAVIGFFDTTHLIEEQDVALGYELGQFDWLHIVAQSDEALLAEARASYEARLVVLWQDGPFSNELSGLDESEYQRLRLFYSPLDAIALSVVYNERIDSLDSASLTSIARSFNVNDFEQTYQMRDSLSDSTRQRIKVILENQGGFTITPALQLSLVYELVIRYDTAITDHEISELLIVVSDFLTEQGQIRDSFNYSLFLENILFLIENSSQKHGVFSISAEDIAMGFDLTTFDVTLRYFSDLTFIREQYQRYSYSFVQINDEYPQWYQYYVSSLVTVRDWRVVTTAEFEFIEEHFDQLARFDTTFFNYDVLADPNFFEIIQDLVEIEENLQASWPEFWQYSDWTRSDIIQLLLMSKDLEFSDSIFIVKELLTGGFDLDEVIMAFSRQFGLNSRLVKRGLISPIENELVSGYQSQVVEIRYLNVYEQDLQDNEVGFSGIYINHGAFVFQQSSTGTVLQQFCEVDCPEPVWQPVYEMTKAGFLGQYADHHFLVQSENGATVLTGEAVVASMTENQQLLDFLSARYTTVVQVNYVPIDDPWIKNRIATSVAQSSLHLPLLVLKADGSLEMLLIEDIQSTDISQTLGDVQGIVPIDLGRNIVDRESVTDIQGGFSNQYMTALRLDEVSGE